MIVVGSVEPVLYNAMSDRGFTGRQRSVQTVVDPVIVCKRRHFSLNTTRKFGVR